MSAYYDRDLAWVHDTGFAGYATRTASEIARLLRESGVAAGARVLDVGCGSGVLARELLAAGYALSGVDASPAMIELARKNAPGAQLSVVSLPAALPPAEAIVSTGHVLAYLGGREAIARAIEEMARALTKPGFIAFDLMTDRYIEARQSTPSYARVEDDWAIFTRYASPAPHRFDRAITVFRRDGDRFRRTDENHENVTFPVEEAIGILRRAGIEARVRATFGDEPKTDGLVVVTGTRR